MSLKDSVYFLLDIVQVPEILILVIYLYISLMLGIAASRKVKSFKDFAIGSRNLPTSVIGMTLCATLIGGGSAMGIATESYKYGLIYILARYGEVIAFLFVAYFIAPRMDKFFGMISVGDIMAKLYGEKFGIVTGICGFLLCVGRVSAQVMALGFVVEYLFGISQIISVMIGLGIVVFYSLIGGVRAVILTDVLQFVLMFVMVPLTLNYSLNTIGGYTGLLNAASAYSYEISFDDLIKYTTLFLYLNFHLLSPPITQRLLICRDKEQVKQSFIILAVGDFIFTTIAGIIGFAAYVVSQELVSNTIYLSIIGEMHGWMKGIGIIGITAIIMSTADSFINSGSVCLVNDALRGFKIKDSTKLFIARISTVLIGIMAAAMALSFKNIFELAMYTSNFWGPIILGPLLAGIFGYKMKASHASIAMICGAITFIVWEAFSLKILTNIHTIFAGMAANFLLTFIAIIIFNSGAVDDQ